MFKQFETEEEYNQHVEGIVAKRQKNLAKENSDLKEKVGDFETEITKLKEKVKTKLNVLETDEYKELQSQLDEEIKKVEGLENEKKSLSQENLKTQIVADYIKNNNGKEIPDSVLNSLDFGKTSEEIQSDLKAKVEHYQSEASKFLGVDLTKQQGQQQTQTGKIDLSGNTGGETSLQQQIEQARANRDIRLVRQLRKQLEQK